MSLLTFPLHFPKVVLAVNPPLQHASEPLWRSLFRAWKGCQGPSALSETLLYKMDLNQQRAKSQPGRELQLHRNKKRADCHKLQHCICDWCKNKPLEASKTYTIYFTLLFFSCLYYRANIVNFELTTNTELKANRVLFWLLVLVSSFCFKFVAFKTIKQLSKKPTM